MRDAQIDVQPQPQLLMLLSRSCLWRRIWQLSNVQSMV